VSDTLLLLVLIAAGFVAGVAIGRWWVAGVVTGVWLVIDLVVLVRRNTSSASEPSTELLILTMVGVTAAAVVVALVGVVLGRMVRASTRENS
jgi:hypothetical protein